MVSAEILNHIQNYLLELRRRGLRANRAVVFGSHANGTPHAWSDIDLVVLLPEFDESHNPEILKTLWQSTGASRDLIEPIACGVKEWDLGVGNVRPIIEVARTQGIEVCLDGQGAEAA